ncbi:MAG TPA: Fic family protein [Thermoanaerobaculia bacterium]
MKRGATGKYEVVSVAGDKVRAFVPIQLPPKPALELGGALQLQLERSLLALGRLDSLATVLPDTPLFLYGYIRKEALLSSQIEGTQSSLAELLLFELPEAPGVPTEDVVEVSNYVAALSHGLERLRGGFPLSNRLLREIHAVLLARGRGSDKDPGHFRRSQNWLGGTRPSDAHFVPPPAHLVEPAMSDLERFLHDDRVALPLLVKAGLAHVQFETIHPFLDGNGRVGRLLITFQLCQAMVLQEPLLYLSLYFKQHRNEYYRLLDRVRTEGDWEAWLEFFLDGVRQTADGAVATARRLVELFEMDRRRIQQLGRAAGSALRVHSALQKRPLTTLGEISTATGLSFPTATSAARHLQKLGIATEITGKKRGRVFAYAQFLAILSEGTEPIHD